jgi:fatty acid desaturase
MVYKHSQGTHKALTRHVRQNLYYKLKVIYTTYIKFLSKLLQAQQVSLSQSISMYDPNKSEACSTVFGFAVATVMLCVVSRALLWHRVGVVAASVVLCGCCGCWCHTVWVLRLLSSRRVWSRGHYCRAACGATGAVITPRVVLWALSSHAVWCCGHSRHTACGVVVTAIMPCGVVAMEGVVAPCGIVVMVVTIVALSSRLVVGPW